MLGTRRAAFTGWWLIVVLIAQVTALSKDEQWEEKLVSRSNLLVQQFSEDQVNQEYSRQANGYATTVDRVVLAIDNTQLCKQKLGCENEYYQHMLIFQHKQVVEYIKTFRDFLVKRADGWGGASLDFKFDQYFEFCQRFETDQSLLRQRSISIEAYKNCKQRIIQEGMDRYLPRGIGSYLDESIDFYKGYKQFYYRCHKDHGPYNSYGQICRTLYTDDIGKDRSEIMQAIRSYSQLYKIDQSEFEELEIVSWVIMAGAIISDNDYQNDNVIGIYNGYKDAEGFQMLNSFSKIYKMTLKEVLVYFSMCNGEVDMSTLYRGIGMMELATVKKVKNRLGSGPLSVPENNRKVIKQVRGRINQNGYKSRRINDQIAAIRKQHQRERDQPRTVVNHSRRRVSSQETVRRNEEQRRAERIKQLAESRRKQREENRRRYLARLKERENQRKEAEAKAQEERERLRKVEEDKRRRQQELLEYQRQQEKLRSEAEERREEQERLRKQEEEEAKKRLQEKQEQERLAREEAQKQQEEENRRQQMIKQRKEQQRLRELAKEQRRQEFIKSQQEQLKKEEEERKRLQAIEQNRLRKEENQRLREEWERKQEEAKQRKQEKLEELRRERQRRPVKRTRSRRPYRFRSTKRSSGIRYGSRRPAQIQKEISSASLTTKGCNRNYIEKGISQEEYSRRLNCALQAAG